MKKLMAVGLVVGALVGFASNALAIPELQIYIEGSTYDSGSETWVYSGSGEVKLWVLGDVDKQGTIFDVQLVAAVATSEMAGGSIGLTPTRTAQVTDPSTPSAPTALGPSVDGAVPVTGDGSALASHGIYGSGVSYFQWDLGDFSLTDSPIGDYITSLPSTFPDDGQINVYTVSISGFTSVHFDAFDHVACGNTTKYVFAPFSHDGEGNGVPEPSTLLLLGTGLLGLGLMRRRRD